MDQCKNCGAPVDEGQALCPACLSAQEQENERPAQEQETELPAQEQETVQSAPAQPTEDGQPEEMTDNEIGEEDCEPEKKPASAQSRRLRSQLLMGGLLLVAAIAVCLVVYFTQGGAGTDTDTEPDITISTPSEQPGNADADTDADDVDADDTDEPVVYPSYTKELSEVTAEDGLTVVATCAGEELTNQMLAYYYWYSYSSFINSYYTYVYYYGLLDTASPLDEQSCYFDDSISWQQYFIDNAVNAFAQFTLLNQRAEAEGFTLSDEIQEELDALSQTLQTAADEAGFASVDAYLQEYYGVFADYETYHAFMTLYYTALSYDDMIYNGFVYDDDEVSAYFDEHASEIGVEKDDSLMVDVRHILIQPVSVEDVTDEDGNVDEAATEQAQTEAWASAKEEAEALYEQWKTGDATEDSFAELAYNESMDTGSYGNGGLYEDVYPGEMITEFNDWCFDKTRQPGDTDIVETSYGYHIMYFVGYGETSYWRQLTQETMVQNAYDDFFTELMADDDSSVDVDSVVLLDPPGLYPDSGETTDDAQ